CARLRRRAALKGCATREAAATSPTCSKIRPAFESAFYGGERYAQVARGSRHAGVGRRMLPRCLDTRVGRGAARRCGAEAWHQAEWRYRDPAGPVEGP